MDTAQTGSINSKPALRKIDINYYILEALWMMEQNDVSQIDD